MPPIRYLGYHESIPLKYEVSITLLIVFFFFFFFYRVIQANDPINCQSWSNRSESVRVKFWLATIF